MKNIRILTAGESHGKSLTGIISGIPAGLDLNIDLINRHLARRQQGAGRGKRMSIEKDTAEIVSGVRFGQTLGSPIGVRIQNRDWENWQEVMSVSGPAAGKPVHIPRPGHADLAGSVKYGHKDIRNVLERASARETAMRVALGSIARQFIGAAGIEIFSHVCSIGHVESGASFVSCCGPDMEASVQAIKRMSDRADASAVRCADKEKARAMEDYIAGAKDRGDSAGGIFETGLCRVPAGLGSYAVWDQRFDAGITAAVMSIPGIKGVEIGAGFRAASLPGSQVHDPILMKHGRIERASNMAGGIEGGITNGQPVIIRSAMKPIPTLVQPLGSIDISDNTPAPAHKERTDVCAVPAAAIVAESMCALYTADQLLCKYGGDSMAEFMKHFGAAREGR